MERAATACYEWLLQHHYKGRSFTIFCGKGNNGGDGLVIARLLAQSNHTVTVYILEFGHKGTVDFQINLARLHETAAVIRFISSSANLHTIPASDVVIDALLGSGINRPADGLTASLIQHINNSGNEVIAIDIPSGLYVDHSAKGNIVIKARHTLSFQCFKPAFLMPENAESVGGLHLLNIGLLPEFLALQDSPYQLVDQAMVSPLIRHRQPFDHKGDYGHAAIIAGSYGMMGAAVLCARACLRSGVGKLTCHVPEAGYTIMQVSVPEAMCRTGENHSPIELGKYDVIGIGPGLGTHVENFDLLNAVFEQNRKPMVIDADGLNTIGQHKELLQKIPPGSILTPHPKEFERLFGKTANDYDRVQTALQKAAEHNLYIVLKGRYTFIAAPDGKGYFNSSGNPGMATGGTGDVLTGIITGLLAQQYTSLHAALAGVFLHGRSGDLAAAYASQPSLIASDLIDFLGQAYQSV
jgi:NAD(P)H-hydrate epimerase